MSPNSITHIPRKAQKSKPEQPEKIKEILCDGYFYDVTSFIKKHPGGSIIEYYTEYGEDATLAIQQFHHRSTKKVTSMLNGFSKRKANLNEIYQDIEIVRKHEALNEDFTKLYLELEKEGMFEPSYLHNILRLIEVIVFGLFGYFLLQHQHYLMKFLGVSLLALAQGRSGWIQHECGHLSITGYPKIDRSLHAIIFGIGLGLSSTWWSKGHNRHHAMPQRLKHDVDLDTLPIIAYNTQVIKTKEQGNTFFIQNQVFLFLLIDTLLGTLIWQLYLHPKYVLKHGYYFELIWMIVHYLIFYEIGFWGWLLSTWLMSIYLFGNFSLSHSHLPITNKPTHWIEYSLVHTVDVSSSTIVNWFMGYLNFQIEHHLFPTMPQFRHSQISERVKAFAEKHGLPYIVYTFPQAVQKTFANLKSVANELKQA